ncbi:MAG: VanZ family protein [bacterium]
MKVAKPAIVIVLICYVAIITILLTVKFPSDIISIGIENIDKIVHFCFYFGLNFLLLLLLKIHTAKVSISRIIYITVVSIIYGYIMEIIQHYVGRDFDVYDIISNTAGALTSLIPYYYIKPCFQSK